MTKVTPHRSHVLVRAARAAADLTQCASTLPQVTPQLTVPLSGVRNTVPQMAQSRSYRATTGRGGAASERHRTLQ
ncbi:hypothetical protein [Azospirillum thermophilum]|uniref:Uncharacterized protein n=1 Tax=Azospirillum thermophilum TaxID=2202148 RepID=A0A2S2D0L9_9PROT|nr:hypothetical protein [Azospirillum thermophilum]AWK90303.1 hypothetical protein DEW08_30265 [Azospirillum thermophilum]